MESTLGKTLKYVRAFGVVGRGMESIEGFELEGLITRSVEVCNRHRSRKATAAFLRIEKI